MIDKSLKKGSLVEVLDWEGIVLKRRVVSVCGNLVFICTDQEFITAKNEGRDPVAVGWPKDAVLALI